MSNKGKPSYQLDPGKYLIYGLVIVVAVAVFIATEPARQAFMLLLAGFSYIGN